MLGQFLYQRLVTTRSPQRFVHSLGLAWLAIMLCLIGSGAHAAAFTETFTADPTGGVVTTFTTNNGGATFTYTFTGDGDGGDMNWDGGNEDINLLSGFPDISPTPERVTITRAGGNEFLFNGIVIDNQFGVATVTVEGYNGGVAQGSSQSVPTGLPPQTLNFGGLTVDEIRITSTDFDNVHFDDFSGDTTVAGNTAPTASSFTAANGPYESATYTFATGDFSYSDSDGDSLSHLLIEALPAAGTLYVDANGSDTYNAGEELSVSDQVSLANLNAGHLQYVQSGSTDTSFQFEVNDGTDTSTGNYVATLNMTPVPTVTLAVSPTSRAESNSTANVVTATLSGSYVANTVVNLGFTGTAAGADYTVSSSTITIAAGSTTGTANIINVDDGAQEGNETVLVDITSVTNGVESGVQQATYTIVDDDFPPSGYTVTLDQASINSANQTAVSFTFAGAEVGATYNYTLSSDGGGSNVTGSGSIATATDQIIGIDVSGLGDGTLTLSATLTNTVGTGAAATDTVSKDATPPSGHSVSFDQASVTPANETGISFTFAGAEVGADYSYTISSDGGGANVTGSGTLASAAAQVSSLDVSGLGDGTLTLSVVLTDTAGNAAAAVTDTLAKDVQVPTGYSVSFDQAYINATNEAAASFTFAGAEVGTTYQYTISSDGGGANVTGSGTIATATEQVPGLDLSGLNDGTLTLSVTLTDSNSNTGVATTDTVTKDVIAPSGYSVSIDLLGEAHINVTNESVIEFMGTGLDVGTTLNYAFTSDGGGAPVTGTETVSTASEQFDNAGAGFDLSGLTDGTITLTVTLEDAAGNVGTDASDTQTKDVGPPAGYSVSWDDTLISAAEATAAPFTVNNAELSATIDYTISSSGDGNTATVTGSLVVTNATQALSADISSLSDGVLTVEVTLTDAGSNIGAPVSDNSASLETIAPSGYSITIDQAMLGSANISAVSFTFAGAEVGASYQYIFSSSGGGANVSGSGVIATATDQVTGINLGAMTPGTITLSVTLEDAAGNLGVAATASRVLASSALSPTHLPVMGWQALLLMCLALMFTGFISLRYRAG